MAVADHVLPTRGPVCPKCGAHIPQFVDLNEKDEARLCELIRNDRKAIEAELEMGCFGAGISQASLGKRSEAPQIA